MKRLAIKIIKLYQLISRGILKYNAGFLLVQPACRYYPTCSDYAIDSFEKYGFIEALRRSALRIAKCNPWADPKSGIN